MQDTLHEVLKTVDIIHTTAPVNSICFNFFLLSLYSIYLCIWSACMQRIVSTGATKAKIEANRRITECSNRIMLLCWKASPSLINAWIRDSLGELQHINCSEHLKREARHNKQCNVMISCYELFFIKYLISQSQTSSMPAMPTCPFAISMAPFLSAQSVA